MLCDSDCLSNNAPLKFDDIYPILDSLSNAKVALTETCQFGMFRDFPLLCMTVGLSKINLPKNEKLYQIK